MSRSKESYSIGDRLQWSNVNSHMRCPVCGKHDWCSVHRSGEVVICRRVAKGGLHKVDRQSTHYWVHLLKDKTPPPHDTLIQTTAVAPREVLHAAYSLVLSMLSLTPQHRQQLRGRGLSDAQIDRGEYSSLPIEGRARLAKAVWDVTNEPLEIPGVFVKTEGYKSWLTLAGPPGLIIPIRDQHGKITALKVRRDKPATGELIGPKYVYVSSNSYGGPSPPQTMHWPLFEGRCYGEIRVTEGPLKADICSVLSPVYTVGIPSANAWLCAITELQQYEGEPLQRVRIAYDSDWKTNHHVANALHEFRTTLTAYTTAKVCTEAWPADQGKGLDDYLLYKKRAA